MTFFMPGLTDIYKTIPGVATKLVSRFMGEIGDINCFPFLIALPKFYTIFFLIYLDKILLIAYYLF